jgi:hypothetical protein
MKDKEVRLNNVINAANVLRLKRGLPNVLMVNYVRSNNFIEAVFAAEIKLGLRKEYDYSGKIPNYARDGTLMNYQIVKSPLVRSLPGKNGGTWVNRFIAIDAATHLDKELAYDIYELLSASPIFQLREDGGDLYKAIYPTVIGLVGENDRAVGKVQLLARVIAARCGVEIRPDNTTWNHANAEQIQKRQSIQSFILSSVDNGLIRSYQVLLEVAAAGTIRGLDALPVDIREVAKADLPGTNDLS